MRQISDAIVAVMLAWMATSQSAISADLPVNRGHEKTAPGQSGSTDVPFIVCRVGIDDYSTMLAKCASPVDSLIPCAVGTDAAIAMVCDINTPQGVIKVPADHEKVSDFSGGECGASTFRVTCHRPGGILVSNDSLGTTNITLQCGQPVNDAALKYCQSAKKPSKKFSAFTTWVQGGGGINQCGTTNIRAICFK